jgi:beta-lactam-binding protein with PASTA domain
MSDNATRTCWKCQRETPADGEFCVHCRAYQNFEATMVVPTVAKADSPPAVDAPQPSSPDVPPPVKAPTKPGLRAQPTPEHRDTLVAPAAGARGGRARLACRAVDGEYAGQSVVIEVPAGGEGRVVVLVENDDEVVDTYDLSVVGLTGGWWSIEPSIVRLFPAAKVDRSRGDVAKQEVEIVVRPPRSSDVPAGRWPARIVARSRVHHDQVASETFAVDVGPFYAFETDVVPARARGRRRGQLRVNVANTGNAELTVALSANDPEGTLRCAFEPNQMALPPRGDATSLLTVRPPRPIIVGRNVERPFAVLADAGAVAPTQSKPVAFRHRAWLPRWVLTVVPLLLVAGLAAWLAFPRYARVPTLIGLNSFGADQALVARGLARGTIDTVTLPNGKGLVIKQDPLPGKRVRKGRKVDIEIAIGTKLLRVPNLIEQLVPAALQQLQSAGFTTGDIIGAGGKPELARVVKQDPPPNAQRQQGTPVTLTVKPPAATLTNTSVPHTVPTALAGLTAAGAVAALKSHGLTPVTVREFNATVASGKVIRTSPKAGSAPTNGTVSLYVSAGYPDIAYDHAGTIVVARGSNGTEIARLPVVVGAQNRDPSWAPNGHWLAFRRGNDTESQIWRADIPGLKHVAPLTEPGHLDGDPAVSPDGRVVAFVQDKTKLCFVRASANAAPGSCLDAGTTIGRPAWAASGAALLALAANTNNHQVEVEQFTTGQPSSPRAHDWHPGALVTNPLHGDRPEDIVASVALAPAGPPRIALAANWGNDINQYTVRTGPADAEGNPVGKPQGSVPGCEVAWRSDGQELAVANLSSCTTSGAEGQIFLVNPATGQSRQLSGVFGAAPAFQPIPLGQ